MFHSSSASWRRVAGLGAGRYGSEISAAAMEISAPNATSPRGTTIINEKSYGDSKNVAEKRPTERRNKNEDTQLYECLRRRQECNFDRINASSLFVLACPGFQQLRRPLFFPFFPPAKQRCLSGQLSFAAISAMKPALINRNECDLSALIQFTLQKIVSTLHCARDARKLTDEQLS